MRDSGHEEDVERAKVASQSSVYHAIPARSCDEPVAASLFFLILTIRDGLVAVDYVNLHCAQVVCETCLARQVMVWQDDSLEQSNC